MKEKESVDKQVATDVAHYNATGVIRLRSFNEIKRIVVEKVRDSERRVDRRERVNCRDFD